MRFFRYCCGHEEVNHDINEQVLVIIRGDALANKNLGALITELEQKFSIIALKSITFTPQLIMKLYPGVQSESFYPQLQRYLLTGFHIAIVIEGENAIHQMVQLKGKSPLTDSEETLRKRFGTSDVVSCIHCSDNFQAAQHEIKLFFKKSEIFNRVPDPEHYFEIGQTREMTK